MTDNWGFAHQTEAIKWNSGSEPPTNGDIVLGYTPNKQLKYTVVYHDGYYWRNSFCATTTVYVEKWINIPRVY